MFALLAMLSQALLHLLASPFPSIILMFQTFQVEGKMLLAASTLWFQAEKH